MQRARWRFNRIPSRSTGDPRICSQWIDLQIVARLLERQLLIGDTAEKVDLVLGARRRRQVDLRLADAGRDLVHVAPGSAVGVSTPARSWKTFAP